MWPDVDKSELASGKGVKELKFRVSIDVFIKLKNEVMWVFKGKIRFVVYMPGDGNKLFSSFKISEI